MKPEEAIALKFLTQRFGVTPSYEPCGRSTAPDFAIGQSAFEVRRLNQHLVIQGGPQALDQTSFRFFQAVKSELEKIPYSATLGSYYWCVRFARPLPGTPGRTARQLASVAKSHYASGSRAHREIEFSHDLAFEMLPRVQSGPEAFVPGIFNDLDDAGFIGPLYINNIELALEDKIRRTHQIASRFDNWVLLLIDHISPGLKKADEIGPLHFTLGHFMSLVVIEPDGSTLLEYPANALGSLTRLESAGPNSTRG